MDPEVGNLVAYAALGSALIYQCSFHLWQAFSNRYVKQYRTLSRDEKLEWNGRSPSTVHAVVLSLCCLYLFTGTNLFATANSSTTTTVPYVLRHSTFSTVVLGFSTGYFIMDLVMLVLYYPLFGDIGVFIHHVAALVSVGYSALSTQGHAYTLLLLSTELTTPLVNNRWLLDKAGLREHPIYLINGLAMAIAWLIFRVLFLAVYFFPLTWKHSNEEKLMSMTTYVLFKSVPVLLTALNIFWFGKIVHGATKLLRIPSNKNKKT